MYKESGTLQKRHSLCSRTNLPVL